MIMMPYGWTVAIAAAHRSGGLLAPHSYRHWPFRCYQAQSAREAAAAAWRGASAHPRSPCRDGRWRSCEAGS